MFGTIGRATLKSGHKSQLESLLNEWKTSIRPKVPGTFLELSGHHADNPNEIVFLALAQDEQTYRDLANLPEQDAFFRRMVEHLESEPTWEDVQMEIIVPD